MGVWLPAFRDGHAHPLFAGREALGPQLDGLKSIEEIKTTVRKWALANPQAEWIVGGAYERSLAPSFLAKWIDEVVPDRPVVLHASDHHTIWVNTEALRRAGVATSFPQVFPGYADLDEEGKPSGTLRESGAMDVVLGVIPALSMNQELDALSWAQDKMLSAGIVQVQDAWIERGMAEVYLEAHARGLLKVRTNLAFRVTPENFEDDFSYFEDLRHKIDALDSKLLTAKTAKFFADGVLGSGTAAVVEPYEDSHHHGEPVWEKQRLLEVTKRYAAAGYQLHIHAIGDAAVRDALDAIEQAPKTILPGVIAHAELIAEQDIQRFADLGVYANMQPLWARPDGMLLSCQPRIGKNRIERMYQMRSLLDSGATISFGSDWPVSSVIPLEGIQTAVTRTFEGQSISPEQRLDANQAYSAYTSAVLSQLGANDLDERVLLSADPRAVAVDEISQIEVLQVTRGDEVLFSN
ncbi:MAG: amidohydrolase [Actinobacteria bacterium]|nr:amidohydrolase [Actinomycetota bacterium]